MADAEYFICTCGRRKFLKTPPDGAPAYVGHCPFCNARWAFVDAARTAGKDISQLQLGMVNAIMLV